MPENTLQILSFGVCYPLQRNHKGKHAVLGNGSRAEQRRRRVFCGSLYSFLYTAGVPAHAPGEERWTSEILFLSLLQANMYMKNFQLLIYHTAMGQDLENLDASSTLATGVGWHRQLPLICPSGTSWAPPVRRPVICIPRQCLLLLHLWIICSSHMGPSQRLPVGYMLQCTLKVFKFHNSHSWIKKLRTDSELMRAQE